MSAAVENKKKVWTEAELEALPGDGYIHEVVNGVGVVSEHNTTGDGITLCHRLSQNFKAEAKAAALAT